jgi:predicted negative regulator of RcsB-dependent stress response
MKEIYKNPALYYILVPVIVALWPLLIWGVYLPRARHNWQAESIQYGEAQTIIGEILTLDPERLAFADSQNAAAEFDYASAVEKVAGLCGISPTNYKLNSGIIITSGGQKSQSAKVSLKQVDVTKFAKFLSTIQLRWANLQCAQVKLTKKKGLPDVWDVDLEFKYYY